MMNETDAPYSIPYGFNNSRVEELQEQVFRLQADLDRNRTIVEQLKEQLEASENETSAINLRERRLITQRDKLQDQAKCEREENAKLKQVINSMETHYQAQLRKSERELVKIRDLYSKSLTDRKANAKFGMEVLNANSKSSDALRAPWRTQIQSGSDNELYRYVSDTFESRINEFQKENEALKKLLFTTHASIAQLLQAHESTMEELNEQLLKAKKKEEQEQEEEANSERKSDSEIDSAAHTSSMSSLEAIPIWKNEISPLSFELPIAMTTVALEKSVNGQLESLQSFCALVSRSWKVSSANCTAKDASNSRLNAAVQKDMEVELTRQSDVIQELQSQIQQLEIVIERQDYLLQQQLTSFASKTSAGSSSNDAQEGSSDSPLLLLTDSFLYEEKENLVEERNKLEQDRSMLEKDRQRVVDSLVRLGEERLLLQQERKILERERSVLMTVHSKNGVTTPIQFRSPLQPLHSQNYKSPSTPLWLKEERVVAKLFP